jgi:UV DNA damage endonuclease
MKPHFGLVCMTASEECRFRTITRTRYLRLPPAEQAAALVELYADNLRRLAAAVDFCRRNSIRLYRMPSSLFPMSDESLGRRVLTKMSPRLLEVGQAAMAAGMRIVNHPEQFVVLSSDRPEVVKTSLAILCKEALVMDLLGLPQTPFASLIIHGGKGGRGGALVRQIGKLPPGIRNRLCLENDEYSYSAAEILDVCKNAGVPMVFDNLHHVIREKIDSYEDPSLRRFTTLARATWPDPDWQLVHLSNGRTSFRDRNHSDLIVEVPSAFRQVRWIEIEAKGKEQAIADLRRTFSGSATSRT